SLGVEGRILDGVLPPAGATVAGAVVGIADFDWASSGARILPGAWCDHLTSFGGALQPDAGQTPLTAWLRGGAAGSGGAVGEPWAFPSKFPSSFLHQHRVEGLSLVEAVHRTLAQPFQYLAVGDPLSRPWGRTGACPPPPRPQISLSWEGSLPITVAAARGRIAVRHLGREIAAAEAGAQGARCVVPAPTLGIGPQELRVHAADGRLMHVILVEVLPPALLPALPSPPATAAGAICPAGVLQEATRGGWADAAAPHGGEVDGLIEVREEGLHQLSWSSARLRGVAWDGTSESATAGAGSMPVSLARGWHRLRLRLAPGPDALEVRFGRHGTRPLAPADWRRPD
ncbi:MAG: hypothetical protein J0M02_07485, partial [Planctomycetes bacterium]|nr:hypothetical protein [Planctomycetota bacterium]